MGNADPERELGRVRLARRIPIHGVDRGKGSTNERRPLRRTNPTGRVQIYENPSP